MTEVTERSSITDSPWYWVLVFSVMALAALLAIGSKYGRRQANIERNYQARERVAEKIAAENNPSGSQRIDDQQAPRPYATPGRNLVTLWPLAILLALVAIAAATMLYRTRRRPGSDHQTTST